MGFLLELKISNIKKHQPS